MKMVTTTELPFTFFKKGKVRDIYELKNNLLLIATDRISAFDYVLPNPIPYKGVCLTQISSFWFDFFIIKKATRCKDFYKFFIIVFCHCIVKLC